MNTLFYSTFRKWELFLKEVKLIGKLVPVV